mgnify:CR=1 FL=1
MTDGPKTRTAGVVLAGVFHVSIERDPEHWADHTMAELLDAWAHESARDTLDRARALAEGPTGILPSTVDPRHPREGVVARATAPGYDRAFKFKGWAFGVLEGYRAAPDREEADEAPADEAEAA